MSIPSWGNGKEHHLSVVGHVLLETNRIVWFGRSLYGVQEWCLTTCIVKVLRGHFWEIYICIFDITMLLPFQIIFWEGLKFVVFFMLLGIVPIAIVILFVDGDQKMALAVIDVWYTILAYNNALCVGNVIPRLHLLVCIWHKSMCCGWGCIECLSFVLSWRAKLGNSRFCFLYIRHYWNSIEFIFYFV